VGAAIGVSNADAVKVLAQIEANLGRQRPPLNAADKAAILAKARLELQPELSP